MSRLTHHRHRAFLAQSGRCHYCSMPMWEADLQAFAMTYGLTQAQANQLRCTAEHLQPRQSNGSNKAENIAAACHYCNQKRHKRKKQLTLEQYRQLVQKRVEAGKWHSRKR